MTDKGDDGEILVAGGGIGGLSCAIALARRGGKVHVFERAASFEEAGAGIQLGPNASRILKRWGVWQALEHDLVLPEALHIHDGLSGARLASVPLGQLEARHGAPYGVVHRAHLQRALLEKARALPGVTITTGFEVTGAEEHGARVVLAGRGGANLKNQTKEGAGLIGADGVHSRLREALKLAPRPRFSGKTAWRALLPAEARPSSFGAADVGLWLGPRAHLVHYPVAGGGQLNVVAVIDEDRHEEGWNAPGRAGELTAHYVDWAEPARSLVGAPETWRKWALAELEPLAAWGTERIMLLGDAAHPMLPFLAQGGAMAIEDASLLAQALETSSGDIEHAFAQLFEAHHERTRRLQARSKRMGQIYHLGGVAALARNWVLKARSAESFLADLDWLYGARIGED